MRLEQKEGGDFVYIFVNFVNKLFNFFFAKLFFLLFYKK